MELTVPHGRAAMVFVRRGSIELEGGKAGTGDLVLLERNGNRISLQGRDEASLLLMGGEPIAEPIVASGPFVMNTEQEIRRAMMACDSGQTGNIAI